MLNIDCCIFLPKILNLVDYSTEEGNAVILSDTFNTFLFIYKNIENYIAVSTEGIHKSSLWCLFWLCWSFTTCLT